MAVIVDSIPPRQTGAAGRNSVWIHDPQWFDGNIWKVGLEDSRVDGRTDVKNQMTTYASALRERWRQRGGDPDSVTVAVRSSENAVYIQAHADNVFAKELAPAAAETKPPFIGRQPVGV